MHYYSQYQQDKFVDKVVLNKKHNGFFLDVGAYDGVIFSNSYFFEKVRNFNGVCIEPNPLVFQLLKERRTSRNLNVCVGNKTGKVKFLCVRGYGAMLSCIYDEGNTKHLARVDETIKVNGGSKEIVEIELITFDEIFKNGSHKIDFFTIDTEGFEFEILKMVDFKKYDVSVLAVEVNNTAVVDFLNSQGYVAFYTLSCDIIFVKKELVNSAMHLRLLKYKIQNKINNILTRFRKAS
jgi:FkbM family methyltransferase